VVGDGGADLMLRFRLEMEDDGTKHCWKMKQRQRAHLGSIERKCDTVTRILLSQKIKKIHTAIQLLQIDGEDLNFKATMS
jgi:hypothetical protein